MKIFHKNLALLTSSSAIALLSAIGCQDAPAVGTAPAQLTTGVLTGFGSVIVNGVHFDTAGASVTIDGEPATLADLDVGMVVNIGGDGKNDAGEEDYEHDDDDDDEEDEEDNALNIETDKEVEGIVLSNSIAPGGDSGTINVMGQTVHVTAETIFESNVVAITSIDLITIDNIVEVSGFSDGNGEIFATRIEVEAVDLASHNDNVELNGNIANLDESAKTFTIGNLTIDYSSASIDADDDGSEDGDDAGLSDGFFVEVESTAGIVNGILIADEVEREDDDGERGHQGGNNDHYDIEGIVTTDYNGSTFTINGVSVVVITGTVFKNGNDSSLTAGTEIEVDGVFNAAGSLIASSIELEDEATGEFVGTIDAGGINLTVGVNVGTITVNGTVIKINNETMMKDETSTEHMFNLTSLLTGNSVEVKTYTDTLGNLVAVQLKRVGL